MKIITKIIFRNTFFIPFFIFFVVFFIEPLNSYFSQDDFFHLRLIMNKYISDLLPLLLPSATPEQTFYRPLSRELYNFIMFSGFGLSALPYHLINLLLIFIIGGLVFWLVSLFTKQKIIAILSTFLYLFNNVHSVELYYLSSIQTLFSTSFILLSLISYFTYLNLHKRKYLFYSIITYTLSLLSHESAAVAILFIPLIEFTFYRKVSKARIKNIISRILPFFIIFSVRFLINIFLSSLPNQLVYQPDFSFKTTVNTFSWFTLWSFGWSEMLPDFMTLTLNLNPNLIKFYGGYVGLIFPLTAIFIFLFGLLAFFLRKKVLKSKILLYSIICYVFSLSPFLLFPQHKFSYYLSLPIVWFSVIVACVISIAWQTHKNFKIICLILITIFVTISYSTSSLNKNTHWAAKRAKAAKVILEDIKLHYPYVKSGTTFYIKNDPVYPSTSKEWGTSSKQAFYILSGSDAFQLLFKDSTIKVYYEDVNKPPLLPESTITYTAKFPY